MDPDGGNLSPGRCVPPLRATKRPPSPIWEGTIMTMSTSPWDMYQTTKTIGETDCWIEGLSDYDKGLSDEEVDSIPGKFKDDDLVPSGHASDDESVDKGEDESIYQGGDDESVDKGDAGNSNDKLLLLSQ